ncbi:MAG: HpcH/HpaI aldolase/citrate lyase family protein [Xanthobacteraceae bacterium]
MPLPRSFLYVPANREKFLDKAVGLPADAFIFDLEDSVPPAEKARARAAIRDYAPKIPDLRVWVRPNALDTEFGRADLDAVIGITGIAGLFVPKVESCDDVRRWDELIGELETKRNLAAGAIKLVLSIESARGVLNAYDMAIAAKRVVSLTFGGAQDGDLNTDLGCAWSIDGPEMLHARSHTLLAARAAGFDTRSTACSPMCVTPMASNATRRCRAAWAIVAASSSTHRRSSPATDCTGRARRSWITTPGF